MMRNRCGLFDPLYLVMLTLFMCGLVLGFYIIDQERLAGSLVSPLSVLEVQDDLEIFEMRERELIRASIGDFDSAAFKESFIGGLTSEMKDFIFLDLIWQDKVMEGEFDRDAFLEKILYKEIYEDSGNLILKRTLIGKRLFLEADSKVDVNFPIDFQFDFEREYLIRRDGSVEVVA